MRWIVSEIIVIRKRNHRLKNGNLVFLFSHRLFIIQKQKNTLISAIFDLIKLKYLESFTVSRQNTLHHYVWPGQMRK